MVPAERIRPTTRYEAEMWAAGRRLVAGLDEVGRGPLAGPIYAAAVVLDWQRLPAWVEDLRDSKQLPAPERERLSDLIRVEALDWSIASASVAEIDSWGIVAANRAALHRALYGLRRSPQFVFVDGPWRLGISHAHRPIVDGDATCASIAAASIIAKVARDRLMCDLDAIYPQYDFASHKGYATRDHLDRLAEHGPCDQHRRTWQPVRLAAEGRLRPSEVTDQTQDPDAEG